jgi:thiol-disulfide isomerase/thioredoxin
VRQYRIEKNGEQMNKRIGLAIFVLTAVTAWAAPQAKAPKDPQLIDMQGYQRMLEKYHGKPLLVTFWATWCEPCRDEYPMLNELAKQYAPKGLSVVGVNMDDDGDLILMRRFIARYKPAFPNYRKKKGEETAFVQSILPGWNGSLPASFLYAKDGGQVGQVIGAGDRQTYEAAIQQLLAVGDKTPASGSTK